MTGQVAVLQSVYTISTTKLKPQLVTCFLPGSEVKTSTVNNKAIRNVSEKYPHGWTFIGIRSPLKKITPYNEAGLLVHILEISLFWRHQWSIVMVWVTPPHTNHNFATYRSKGSCHYIKPCKVFRMDLCTASIIQFCIFWCLQYHGREYCVALLDNPYSHIQTYKGSSLPISLSSRHAKGSRAVNLVLMHKVSLQ